MTERMVNHKGEVLKGDLGDTHVRCDCGSFEFKGDWDDMCHAWDQHVGANGYDEMIRAEPIFLTREGARRMKEIMAEPRKPLPELPLDMKKWK